MGGATWGLGLPRAEREAGFDFVVASAPALARGCGTAKGVPKAQPRPLARAARGVPCTRGPGGKRRSSLEDPPSRLQGASRQDVQLVIFNFLASYAVGGSGSIGVAIVRRSPGGVHVLVGEGMPGIPEGQPLAWCARESIRSEEDCWTESASIVHLLRGEGPPLLAPGEVSTVGPGLSRQWRRFSCPLLLRRAKDALLQRRAADRKKGRIVKRVVPVVLAADDGWVDGGQSLSGMPHGPRAHWPGLHARNATSRSWLEDMG